MFLEYPIFPFNKLGPISTNFYLRGIMYLLFVIPTMIQAPTMTGGMCLLCAAATYLRAAVNGEEYKPPAKKGAGGRRK
ncbi:hypothetical protein HK102_005005 [Quaeritorhiza haematococci]|nr:hypothetical protein HK102_005005 [Quaeritorhiza haematococci]